MPHQHEQRTDLAGEHRLTDIGQLIGLLIFSAVWILDSFVFTFSIFLSGVIPLYIRIPVAVVLLVFSFVMAITSHKIIFIERRDPPTVITKSFFNYVRHPLYLSELIGYLGLFMFSLPLASLLVIIIIFLFLNYVASAEEKKLEAKFGTEYHEYKKEVGRWFPKLLRKR